MQNLCCPVRDTFEMGLFLSLIELAEFSQSYRWHCYGPPTRQREFEPHGGRVHYAGIDQESFQQPKDQQRLFKRLFL